MKYLEVSKKINLSKNASPEDVKKALTERLKRAFLVTELNDAANGFEFTGTTGGPGKFTRHARVRMNTSVILDKGVVRVLMNGYCDVATSLMLLYSVLFFTVLLTGLLPGSIATSGEDSGAMDAMVFLIFGIFIFCDLAKKVCEPKEQLQSILDSLETEFG